MNTSPVVKLTMVNVYLSPSNRLTFFVPLPYDEKGKAHLPHGTLTKLLQQAHGRKVVSCTGVVTT